MVNKSNPFICLFFFGGEVPTKCASDPVINGGHYNPI